MSLFYVAVEDHLKREKPVFIVLYRFLDCIIHFQWVPKVNYHASMNYHTLAPFSPLAPGNPGKPVEPYVRNQCKYQSISTAKQ